jgi:hypothetical protein
MSCFSEFLGLSSLASHTFVPDSVACVVVFLKPSHRSALVGITSFSTFWPASICCFRCWCRFPSLCYRHQAYRRLSSKITRTTLDNLFKGDSIYNCFCFVLVLKTNLLQTSPIEESSIRSAAISED